LSKYISRDTYDDETSVLCISVPIFMSNTEQEKYPRRRRAGTITRRKLKKIAASGSKVYPR
jgi:hypothetical protein